MAQLGLVSSLRPIKCGQKSEINKNMSVEIVLMRKGSSEANPQRILQQSCIVTVYCKDSSSRERSSQKYLINNYHILKNDMRWLNLKVCTGANFNKINQGSKLI